MRNTAGYPGFSISYEISYHPVFTVCYQTLQAALQAKRRNLHNSPCIQTHKLKQVWSTRGEWPGLLEEVPNHRAVDEDVLLYQQAAQDDQDVANVNLEDVFYSFFITSFLVTIFGQKRIDPH